jgi:hypothetical protein
VSAKGRSSHWMKFHRSFRSPQAGTVVASADLNWLSSRSVPSLGIR